MVLQGRIPTRYRVIEEVGQGGMAVVYRAHDETLHREVAVKLLHPHLLAEKESKVRLEREAQAVAKLQHDNIVQIFDYSGQDAAASFIVTEFVDGQTLKQFVTGRKVPAPEIAAAVAHEIGSALVHAHSLGILHRDVKPENVMVRKDGALKLMDFGVAQIMDLERMTVTGQLLGSPAYMAPELLEGKPLDVRTDVFSVGIMLYQLATGVLPFSGRNPHEVLKRIAEGRFTDPRTVNRLVADRLAKIIARALARRPEDRYPTVSALLVDLAGFLEDAGFESPREELRQYFVDADGYEKTLPTRMMTALVAAGKRERVAGRTARALELWNRALAIDPSNQEVLRELKRLEGRQYLKRLAIGAVALGAVGAGVLGLLARVETEVPVTLKVAPPETKPVAAKPVVPPPIVAAKVEPPNQKRKSGEIRRPDSRKVAGTEVPPPGEPAKAVVAKPVAGPPRILDLVPKPANVEVWLDGKDLGAFGPTNNSVAIPQDGETHLIEIRPRQIKTVDGQIRPVCCTAFSKKIGPDFKFPDDRRLVAILAGKPASLTLKVAPDLAGRVLLEEVDRGPDDQHPAWTSGGTLGALMTVPFDGDDDLKKDLRVTVSIEGRPAKVFRLTITAGETKTQTLALQ